MLAKGPPAIIVGSFYNWIWTIQQWDLFCQIIKRISVGDFLRIDFLVRPIKFVYIVVQLVYQIWYHDFLARISLKVKYWGIMNTQSNLFLDASTAVIP